MRALQSSTHRRFPRIPSEHPVLLRLLDHRNEEQISRTRVIAVGGCLLVSRESMGFRSLLDLKISIHGRIVHADGRIAYEIKRPEGWEVGVEFLRLEDEGRRMIQDLVDRRREVLGRSFG